MNQKQVNEMFKDSEKTVINTIDLPSEIQKRLPYKNYTGIKESIRENADLLLIQDNFTNKPKILLLLEREPFGVEIIKEFI